MPSCLPALCVHPATLSPCAHLCQQPRALAPTSASNPEPLRPPLPATPSPCAHLCQHRHGTGAHQRCACCAALRAAAETDKCGKRVPLDLRVEKIRAAAAERALYRQAWRDAIKRLATLGFKKPQHVGRMTRPCARRGWSG
eukprot:65282-Chlamydomonas_euryale.AAC.2